MKIGIYQSSIVWEDKKKNIEMLKDLLASRVECSLDLLLLPEMSFTGFSMNTEITAEENGESLRNVSDIARQYKTRIGFGWVKKLEDRFFNCYSIVNGEGESLSEYYKIHPFFSEQNRVTKGTAITSFSIGSIPFSTFICYDLRFPEVFRIAARWAHIIVVAANWPKSRREHWITLLKARAVENQVYILGVNCVGNIGGTDYSGDSCVICPDGNVEMVKTDEEGLLVYDLNDNVEEIRKSFPVHKDSRWDMYSAMYKGLIDDGI